MFESTSIDYNKDSEEAYTFFKIIQNKLHYAISGHTAEELIYERAYASKEYMGLTNWKHSPNGKIMKFDISIVKNYLNDQEIKKLESLTTLFLDYAEDMANEHHLMTMQKWIDATGDLLKFRIKQDKTYISSMDELYERYLEEKINKIKIKVTKVTFIIYLILFSQSFLLFYKEYKI